MRRPRIHEQIASADETTTTQKKIGIAVRGQKGAADARTDRRRSNRSTLPLLLGCFFARTVPRPQAMSLLDYELRQPPSDVIRAANSADETPQQIELVRSWLAAATNVHQLSNVLGDLAYNISTAKIDLARLAIARGADPNIPCNNGYTPFHIALSCRPYTIATPAFVALLLDAGADLNQRLVNSTLPLGAAIRTLMCCVDDDRRIVLQVMTLLLRAGSAIDCVDAAEEDSAEEYMAFWERDRPNPIPRDEPFRVFTALLRGVRAAGSWRAYERRFHRGTLPRFRSLVVRGRATSSDALLGALAHLPHRPFRTVLAFGP